MDGTRVGKRDRERERETERARDRWSQIGK